LKWNPAISQQGWDFSLLFLSKSEASMYERSTPTTEAPLEHHFSMGDVGSRVG